MNTIRLTANDWILKGFDTLADDGPEALKAEILARKIGASKGSFYWHFKDVRDFHLRMLGYWEEKAATDVSRILEGTPDPVERLFQLGELSVVSAAQHGDSVFEPAIHAWAQGNANVAAAVQRVDVQRLAHISNALSRLDLTNPDLARVIYAAYVGFGSLGDRDEVSNRAAMSTLLASMLALRDA
ncbi:MAG: TetR/AcrR family transcriptional regulator [Rhodobacteraceae bacterium]|nr:TetR/AcrR family transcriptional regulator [Paracoccaceae bacterium]